MRAAYLSIKDAVDSLLTAVGDGEVLNDVPQGAVLTNREDLAGHVQELGIRWGTVAHVAGMKSP